MSAMERKFNLQHKKIGGRRGFIGSTFVQGVIRHRQGVGDKAGKDFLNEKTVHFDLL